MPPICLMIMEFDKPKQENSKFVRVPGVSATNLRESKKFSLLVDA